MLSIMETVFGRSSLSSRRLSMSERIHKAWALHRSRLRLAQLEPHMLSDIGLDAETAQIEAQRPVWDAPDVWKR